MARTNTFIKSNKTPTSQEEYIASLDPLLRKNRGASTLFGYETSNTPFLVPEGSKAVNPEGLQGYDTNVLPTDYTGMMQSPQMMNQSYDPSSDRTDSIQFLNRIKQSAAPQAVQQMSDGGVMFSDGVVRYSDGSTLLPDGTKTQPVYGIQQFASGNVLMSDGSIKTQEQLQQTGDPLSDLQRFFFGQVFDITQAYGNYNPSLEPGSGYNYGTDIGASYQPINLPFRGQVVQVFQDDGTRWGDQSGHQGYGNSVLIQLENGTYLRFSHLADVPQWQEGDILEPGQILGVTGATGNVTGPHLDLEYYDQNGMKQNPSNFDFSAASQIVKQGEEKASEEEKQVRDEYLRTSGVNQSRQEPQGEVLNTQTQPQEPTYGNVPVDFNALNVPQKIGYATNELVKDNTQALESYGAERGLPEFYAGEGARPRSEENRFGYTNNRATGQVLGNVIDTVFTKARAPEVGFSEWAAGNTTQNTGRIDSLQYKASRGLQNMAQNTKDFGRGIGETFRENYVQPVFAQDQEINPSNEIGQTVNASLIKDKILNTLNELKGQVLGDNTFKPTSPMETRAIGAGQGIGENAGLQSKAPTQSIPQTQSKAPEAQSKPVQTFAKAPSKSSSSKPSSRSSSSKQSSVNQSKAPTQSIAPKAAKVTYTQSAKNQSPANVSYQSKAPTQSIAPKTVSKPKTTTFQKAVTKALTFLKSIFK